MDFWMSNPFKTVHHMLATQQAPHLTPSFILHVMSQQDGSISPFRAEANQVMKHTHGQHPRSGSCDGTQAVYTLPFFLFKGDFRTLCQTFPLRSIHQEWPDWELGKVQMSLPRKVWFHKGAGLLGSLSMTG